MSDTSLMNSDTNRTPTGEIKDQSTPPTEVKPTETPTPLTETPKPAEGEGDEKSLLNQKEPKKEGTPQAPEKYEFKVPDGFVLDEADEKEASELFRGLDISQDGAQKLVDFYVAKTQEAANAPVKLWIDTQAKWVAEMKADPQLGGKLPEVKNTIAKAIDGLGDPKLASAFREAMDFTGAGNNPAFIRAFYKLAQQITEGGHVAGRGPSEGGQRLQSQPTSAGRALYPNLP